MFLVANKKSLCVASLSSVTQLGKEMRVNTKKPLSFFWPQPQLKMLHNSISSFIMFRCNKDGARGHRRSQGKVWNLGTLEESRPVNDCVSQAPHAAATMTTSTAAVVIMMIRFNFTRPDLISLMES